MTDPWYAQSLRELKALLDQIGDEGEVTLRPGDDAVAAIIAQMNAMTVLYSAAQLVHQAKATLALLETN